MPNQKQFVRQTVAVLLAFDLIAVLLPGVAALALPVSAQTPAALTASDAPKQKPNIIVILADDFGWGNLGCYGAPAQLKTPHLDRLAREGRRFTNAYAPSSVCSPTRYGLMTGRYDWRTRGDGGGVIGKEAPLQKDIFAANADLAAQMQKILSEARDRGYTRPDAGK